VKRLLYARKALSDLDEVWDYSEEVWGTAQANRYLDDLRRGIEGLAHARTASRSAEEVRPGLRKAVIKQHAVFFRESDDVIKVIRVLHQRRDAGRWV